MSNWIPLPYGVPVPEQVSAAQALVGVATTALGSIMLTKLGLPVPLVVKDLRAPMGPPGSEWER